MKTAFTNEQILAAALAQSAMDAGCAPEDFLRAGNVIVEIGRAHV